jgi:tRNA A-37 threonylcarbamoyl transferase component Bud32
MTARCAVCAQEVPPGSRFCPACGSALSVGDAVETAIFAPPPPPSAPTSTQSVLPSDSAPAGRFAPGETIAGRYRIVTLLGKGGMGEVYRADDLRLGQSVALKFLPAELADNADWLARFHNEVRIARQVSHANVCRVHDVGEVDGQPFLSMEYIDGEDLSSLLKRIGRLPEDKAIELARQLCAGLAAAHDRGVLHRDLKPHNIMIDGRGQVRITDFGLAGQAGDIQGVDIRAGTPAYQAPEQAAGREVTARSDLYSLGLVLYEMFTGKKVFEADSRVEMARLHAEGRPITPSSHVSGLDPSVEKIILRCLEKDPAQRPSSAVAVAAALPGGDPLAAALAAGQTPSPQMVAQAGGEGILAPAPALALFLTALAGMLAVGWLNDRVALFRQTPADLSPRELSVRSRTFLRQLGYPETAADRAWGIATDEPLLDYLTRKTEPAQRWQGIGEGQPAVMYFWYRQGPRRLVQRLTPSDINGWSMPGRVMPNEPPLREPGMVCVFLGLDGRLLEFHAVPPHTVPEGLAPKVNWTPLLDAAGLGKTQLYPTAPPQRVPPAFADVRAAWEAHYPDRPDLPLRVEAASFAGRPVYFHVGPPGVRERLYAEFVPGGSESLIDLFYAALALIALPIGGWMAWQNWQAGRANPTGASRLVGFYLALALGGWLLAAKHALSPGDEMALFAGMLGRALVDGITLWLAYLALEPWVRRRSPWRLIAWSRLLAGKWRDPLVGRAVLVGVLGGAGGAVLASLLHAGPAWLGWPADYQTSWDPPFTEGAGDILLTAQFALQVGLRDFFFFFILFLIFRRDWLAAPLALAVWVSPSLLGGGAYPSVQFLVNLCFYGLGLLLLLRFGFLTYVVYNFTDALLKYLPVTLDLSAWYAGVSTLSLLVLAGLAGYGLLAARGRRPLGTWMLPAS